MLILSENVKMRKRQWKRYYLITIFLLMAILWFQYSNGHQSADKSENITKQSQTSFTPGNDLKGAIQLLSFYDKFDSKELRNDSYWKEYFISKFIKNSRFSFGYLEKISKKSKGIIGVKDLNYMQKSLTGEDLDFSEFQNKVNINDCTSGTVDAKLTDFSCEAIGKKIFLRGIVEFEDDPISSGNIIERRNIEVELFVNKNSCFDGYSITMIKTQKVESTVMYNNRTCVFYGTDMETDEDGIFTLEFTAKEDYDISYHHFVYLNLKELPQMAAFVRKHKGEDFKITFKMNGKMPDIIEKVVPSKIELEK